MYRKIMEKLRKRKNEKGIAVIFVLGILGLLTVIGLGFASTALLDNTIAKNNVNNEKARLMARSAFLRAYLLLLQGADSRKIYTRSSPVTYDWLWRLNTTMDGIDIYALPSQFDPEANNVMPSWQYVYRGTGSNREIVGRFAYVVQEEKAKMDPSVHFGRYLALDHANLTSTPRLKRFGTSEAELSFRDAISETNSIYDQIQKELYDDLFDNSKDAFASLEKPESGFIAPLRWQDFASMWSEVSVGGITSDHKDDVRDAVETLQVGAPETFWIDKDNDKKQTSDEMFHRFNLARTDWDKAYFDDVHILFGRVSKETRIKSTVNGLEETCMYNARPSGDKNLVRQDKDRADSNDVGSADSCYDTGGIQWLGTLKDDDYKSSTNVDVIKRKQIAANIIQYCRKDTSLTVTDLAAPAKNDWVANNAEPLYAGVGKHPVLNEAALKASVIATVTETPVTDNPSTYNWSYGVTFSFGAELIDMFNLKKAGLRKSEVYIYGKLAFQYYDLTAKEYKDFTIKLNSSNGKIEIMPDAASAHWKDNGYTLETKFWNDLPIAVTPTGEFTDDAGKNFKENLLVKNVKLEIDRLYLKYADSAATPVMRDRDFAKLARTFATAADTEIRVDEEKFFYGAVAAEDPRVNHYPVDWKSIYDTNDPVAGKDTDNNFTITAYTVAPVFDGTSVKTTLGEKNFTLDLSAGKVKYNSDAAGAVSDKETASDPALGTISTAYIAERPILSLWELGAISRAEKWRTINLKKSVPHAEDAAVCGDRDKFLALGDAGYEAGDGNILDQVKINRLLLDKRQENILNSANDDAVIDETAYPAYITEELKSFWAERIATFGKININTLSQSVLEALFKNLTVNTTELEDVAGTSRTAYYHFVGMEKRTEPGTEFNNTSLISAILRDPGSGDAKKSTYFRTRADILLPNYALADSFSVGDCDAAQEQVIGKTINLLKAEPLDKAYIVAIAQTIKAVEVPAGSTRYFDWNRDGVVDNDDAVSVSNTAKIRTKFEKNETAWKNAGYVRYPLAGELHGDSTHKKDERLRGIGFGNKTLSKDYTASKGKDTYVNGVDLITGTAKVVVTLERVENKWKIVRFEYVD